MTGGPSPALEVRDVTVSRGGRVVLDVRALAIRRGEVLVVIGPNGSGKSTMIQCFSFLLAPDCGEIALDGRSVGGRRSLLNARRQLAVVFQQPLLLDASVIENVMLGLRLRGVRADEARERARRWMERFGIAHLAERRAPTLSGGEAQRASLARALVVDPTVVFLDEPFSALDAPTRQRLLEDFQELLRETRVTTVLVTHDRNEAVALADRVAVLIDGRIRQIGLPREVFSSPADEAVASFAGVENILPGVVSEQDDGVAHVEVDSHVLQAVSAVPAGRDVAVCLRPEDITVVKPGTSEGATSARNRMRARVVRVFPVGSMVRVTLDCGFPLVALFTRSSQEEMGLAPGQEVVATFKASAVHLIERRQNHHAAITSS